jgi:peptidoglycan-associated lipoprotein
VNYFKMKKLAVVLCLGAIIVLAGCHKKAVVPPPPPPPPPPAAPSASLRANPDVIERGESTTLVWSTSNASSVTIDGVGPVAANGSESVGPGASTTYTLTAKGAGGTAAASARVTVNQPAPPAPPPAKPSMTEEELFSANTKDIYFDYDKYNLRAGESSAVEQDAAFLKQHVGMKVVIVGHCDDRGSAEYNIALGQNRAETMQKALVSDGVDASRIRVISVGEEQPFCREETEQCWQQNRRAHVMLDR